MLIELTEAFLITLTLAAMVGVMFASTIPFVPGAVLMWLAAIVFGVVNGFERLTVGAAVLITIVAAIGATSDLWLPVLGLRAGGISCWSTLGTIIGGLAGTVLIPVPVCGTLIGAVAGALLFEYTQTRDLRIAVTTGQTAFRLFLIGLALELGTGLIIIIIFVLSIVSTTPAP